MNAVGSFRGHFFRVRVIHDVRIPLTCFVLTSRSRKIYLYTIKYENLGKYDLPVELLATLQRNVV
jgi:hypothetical protein